MATTNPALEYHKIIDVEEEGPNVLLERWKNKAARDSNDPYDKPEVVRVHTPKLDLSVLADPTKSIKDNKTTAGYKALLFVKGYTDHIEA